MFFRRLARLLDPRNFFLPEETAVKPMKLSEAIMKGIPLVTETIRSYRGCAIGTGYWAKTGKELNSDSNACNCVSKEFGVPIAIVRAVSCLHLNGLSRRAVAMWLGSKGF